MYLQGTISINLKGTQVRIRPPSSFFSGIANLVTKGTWSESFQQETFKLMALAQAIYHILQECGVRDVIRVAVGDSVIYEDFEHLPDDLNLAMEALRHKVEDGLDLGYLEKFDLSLEHDDGALSYVIDCGIYREHRPGMDPIVIRITGISSQLKRRPDESTETYYARTKRYFDTQEAFNQFRQQLEARFETFLDQLKAAFSHRLGIEQIQADMETRVVRKMEGDTANWEAYTGYGGPFYGYDAMNDLFALMVWQDLMTTSDLSMGDFAYVEPGGEVLTEVTADEWTGSDFDQFEETYIPASADAGGGLIDTEAIDGDSGGGGWLDSVGDFSDDAGGGGDIDIS